MKKFQFLRPHRMKQIEQCISREEAQRATVSTAPRIAMQYYARWFYWSSHRHSFAGRCRARCMLHHDEPRQKKGAPHADDVVNRKPYAPGRTMIVWANAPMAPTMLPDNRMTAHVRYATAAYAINYTTIVFRLDELIYFLCAHNSKTSEE